MADDGAPNAEEIQQQLLDRLREVGERLQAPPGEAEDLLKLLKVSLLFSPSAFTCLVWLLRIC
jgi:hypothetical protein